jgi:hypothetical protein
MTTVYRPYRTDPQTCKTQEETLRRVFHVIGWQRNDYNSAQIDEILKEIRNAFGMPAGEDPSK